MLMMTEEQTKEVEKEIVEEITGDSEE